MAGNDSRKGTNNESATGLGLVICKEFVEKMGGKIWLESKKGEGTTFFFSLKTNHKFESNTLPQAAGVSL